MSGFKPDALIESLPKRIQVYVVGGAVRDELLGQPQADRDWVLVGASPEDLLPLGFKPVGADFPVFLHPHTQDEYALARTERKSGHGYKGFVFHASPDVTLQQDLERRDFTVNAMAMAADGSLFDPFDGYSDLKAGVMRHVSTAFAEDPLRILRLARFLARFTTFSVAPGTFALCQQLVDGGEVAHLVPERVFAELNKGMAEPMPSRMFHLLMQLQAWPVLLGGNSSPTSGPIEPIDPSGSVDPSTPPLLNLSMEVLELLDAQVAAGPSLAEARWIFLLGYLASEADISRLGQGLRMPSQLLDEARVAAQIRNFMRAASAADQPNASAYLELLARVDVYRKPDRLLRVLSVFEHWPPQIQQGRIMHHLRQAALQQSSGAYTTGLRQFMAAQAGVAPVELVAQFKSEWLAQLLNT